MAALAQDLRHGFRVLVKSPGFSAAAVVVLALGIGANTAIFSVVDAVLFRPLPFEDAGRLVSVWHVPPQKSFPGMGTFAVSPANYLDWRSQNHVFEGMAAYGGHAFSLTGGDRPEAVGAATVVADFFSVLRARPILGRDFDAQEDRPGHGDVVILGEAFWRSHFASSPEAVGRSLRLDGRSFTIIGVMAATVRFPDQAQIWTPLAWTDKERAVRNNHNYAVIARLGPGANLGRAQAEMTIISGRLERQYPDDDQGWGAIIVPLRDDLVGDVRPALLILLGAVAFVLLIACANVANLGLARTLGRQKEMAIRAALGASRLRVLRQVLTESMLLAFAGGALGLLLASFGVDLLAALLSGKLPRAEAIAVDGRVLAFTLAASVLAGIVAGLAPAWRATTADLNRSLKQGLGRTDSDAVGARTRGALVISEVALSLILLAGAGLMIRSLWALRRVDPGFDPHGVLTLRLAIPTSSYPEPARQSAFYDQVLERVRALPGVESAAVIDTLPLTGGGSMQPVAIDGRPAGLFAEQPEVAVRRITPGYLKTLRVPLKQGRDFGDADVVDRPAAVLISESMAKRFWPDENPIGRRVTLSFLPGAPREVVGVVGDVKHRGLEVLEPSPTLYVPLAQIPGPFMVLLVRTDGPPSRLTPSVAGAIHQVDPELPVAEESSMDDVLAASLIQQQFSMRLLAGFAALALFLAAMGIYSVLAYAVRRRVREIGIRRALGAQVGDVLRMIVFEEMRPALIGVALGLAGALALAPVLGNLLYGVKPADPLTYSGVTVLLAVVALVASVVPAYRATRIEPVDALREE